jgi:retron-type reverse transcriptase
MQSKLARWSTENKERKFDRLLRLIANTSWLAEAARITLTSSGAKTAGVDGIVGNAMKENLQDHLKEISAELLAGTYEPLPAKRVYIPKANGKLRPLGIPTVSSQCTSHIFI